jgi:L-fuculose-phosphate aldolase
MDQALVGQLVDAARAVVAGRAISANGHGNISVRVPGEDAMAFSSAASLNALGPQDIALVGLDGSLLEGTLTPIQAAVVAMHTFLYRHDPEVGAVLHTHAPAATAFAVARRPIDCWIEAMAMFGLADGVPVAGYAPRGSDEAVANIRDALRPGVPAVLLANHGVLTFHRTTELAVLVNGVIEEAAQAALAAEAIGGPVVVEPEMRAAALQRAMAFAAAGTRTA